MTGLKTGSFRPVRTVYSTLNVAERSSTRPLRVHPALAAASKSSRSRTYATQKPGGSKDGNKKSGKPAAGFSDLYKQPSMNANQTKSTSDSSEKSRSKATIKCTPEEAELLDQIAAPFVVTGLSPSKEFVPEYFEYCKQTGNIPEEVREVMQLQRTGDLFALRNTLKMTRVQLLATEHCEAKPRDQWLTLHNPQEKTETRKEKEAEDGANNIVKCSPEDEKLIDEVLKAIKVFPANMIKPVVPILEMAKTKGITPEVREILDMQKKQGSLSLSSILKLIRLTNKAMLDSLNSSGENQSDSSGKSGNSSKQGQGSSGGSGGGTGGGGGSGGPGGGFKFDLNTAIVALFTTYITYKVVAPAELGKDITWQEFNTAFLQKGLVEKLVVFDEKRVKVYLHREALRSQHPDSPAANENFFYYFTIGSVEGFERRLEQAQDQLQIPTSERIPVSYERGGGGIVSSLLINLIPTALLLGGLYYMSRRAGGGAGGSGGVFGMGRSRAKKFNHETDIKVKFADVAGMDEAKVEIMEFVSFLKTPERFEKLGAKIPRGAILSGPPGTGKTLLAKATAGESGVPFFSVSGAEFVEIFVGVGPSRVRDLFANARKNTPCIIFIDEIDAIGRSRGKNNFNGGNDEREATLNQILTEMDGFNTSEQVVVLAGTNRPDILDSALMRPGRFDRHIAIDRPTMEGRKQIFAVHLKKIVTKEDMEHLTGRLAALTPGFSGADIANCANEAALIAARANADTVEMKHFEAAIERTIGGLEKKSLVLSPEEKRVVAYHEAGHAICGWFFKYADPLLKVSIIPRGQGALGYAQYLPAGDTYLMNEFQFMDRMAMTLGGRVSEELHFETVTSGASDDFNKVTRMATAMVTKYGMSEKIGRVYYEDDQQQQLHKPFSEQTAREIDIEVKRIADAAYKQCKDLLTAKKKEVGLVAEELLKKEMLVRDDLIRLLGRRPFEDKAEFEKYFSGGQGAGQKSAPPPPPQETGNDASLPDTPPAPQPAMKQHESTEQDKKSI